MKVMVIGVVAMSGISRKSGTPKPYDMAKVYFGVPVSPIEKEERTLKGYGYEVQDLDLSAEALPRFQEIKFPAVLDLDVQPNPQNLRRNICVGIRA